MGKSKKTWKNFEDIYEDSHQHEVFPQKKYAPNKSYNNQNYNDFGYENDFNLKSKPKANYQKFTNY